MKIKLIILVAVIVILTAVHAATVVRAAPTSTIVQNLIITGIKPSSGTSTLSIDSTGKVGTTTITGGSGSAATTTINGVSGPTFTISIVTTSSASSITTSSAQLFLNLLTHTATGAISISPTGTIIFTNPGYLLNSNNLSDLTSSTVARSNLGLGTLATVNSPTPIANGGTATTTTPADNALLVGNGTAYIFSTLPDCTSSQTPHYTTSTHSWSCQTDANTGAPTINGINTSTFVFATAGPGLTIASSGFTITTTFSSSSLNLGNISLLNSPVGVANGGTGATTMPKGLVIASGTTAFTSLATGQNGSIPIASGTDWIAGVIAATSPVTYTTSTGGGTIACPTCLTANQTITLTGAVTGSGPTSISTVFTTSTLYALFSGSSPISFNTTTGAISCPTCLVTAVTSANGITGALTIEGTANRVTVSSSSQTITLSGPQDIDTSAKPTFGGLTLTGNATGTSATFTGGITQSGAVNSIASTTIAGHATTTSFTITGLGTSGSNCVTAGSNGKLATTTCGSTSPGGSDTHVQFNNGGSFGGSSNLTFNSTTPQLALSNGSSSIAIGASSQFTAGALASSSNYSLAVGGNILTGGGTPTVTAATGTVTQTFSATGATSSWIVPGGVTSITINAVGGEGGNAGTSPGTPGKGGSATGTLAVTPGTTYYFCVGGVGATGTTSGGAGGFCGGGAGGNGGGANQGGGGGGGMTWFSASPSFATSTVIIVGAGGAGSSQSQNGGNGGGLTGANGNESGAGKGFGGSQTAGGNGGSGTAGADGTAGSAGAGGAAGAGAGTGSGGGGGGAGFFGGGGAEGGATGVQGGGGGGGSSFATSTLTTTSTAASTNTASGTLKISYVGPTINGNNTAGTITLATSTATTTITFASPAFKNTPVCTVTPNAFHTLYITSKSTTAFTVTASSSMAANETFDYVCLGY